MASGMVASRLLGPLRGGLVIGGSKKKDVMAGAGPRLLGVYPRRFARSAQAFLLFAVLSARVMALLSESRAHQPAHS